MITCINPPHSPKEFKLITDPNVKGLVFRYFIRKNLKYFIQCHYLDGCSLGNRSTSTLHLIVMSNIFIRVRSNLGKFKNMQHGLNYSWSIKGHADSGLQKKSHDMTFIRIPFLVLNTPELRLFWSKSNMHCVTLTNYTLFRSHYLHSPLT